MNQLRVLPNDVEQSEKAKILSKNIRNRFTTLPSIQKIILLVKNGIALCWYLAGLAISCFFLINIYKIILWLNKYLGTLFSKLPYWNG